MTTKDEARYNMTEITAVLREGYSYFRKPKFTVLIILSLIILFALGLVVPQKRSFLSQNQYVQWKQQYPVIARIIETLHFNEIYIAPITILFLGLFFINLLVVIVHRIPLVLRRSYLLDNSKHLIALKHVAEDPAVRQITISCNNEDQTPAIADKVASFFRQRFWSVLRTDDSHSILAVRNRYSPVGFLLFHISFLLCLAGGLLVVYTRFSGNLTLTEGEEFKSDIRQFRLIKNDPVLFKALPELGITLLKVSPVYEGSVATDLNVLLRVKYFSDFFDAKSKINEPVSIGEVSILPVTIGISPLFVLKKDDHEIGGAYFILNVLKGSEDSFEFSGLPYKITVRFFPDFVDETENPATKSLEMKNPVFRLRVERDGEKIYEGNMRLGESVGFDGLALSCQDIRYWVDFLVIREYGNVLLITGFILGAIGLIMRLVFYQKTVRVCFDHDDRTCVVYITGRSEYYERTFQEEMDSIYKAIASRIKA